jgi:hypothetical protein
VKTGVQGFYNRLFFLDSDFRRNDKTDSPRLFAKPPFYKADFFKDNRLADYKNRSTRQAGLVWSFNLPNGKEYFMKKGFVLLMVLVFGLVLTAGAMAEEKKGEAKEKGEVKESKEKKESKEAKPSGMKEQTVEATATVEAIDLDKRIVTLKGPKGNVFELKVGERAKNLSQVKVGDQVKVKYYESLAFEVKKAGAAGEATVTSGVARAKEGEKPGGIAANQVTITATVEAIDAKKNYVTLKGPEGKILEVKVKDPKNLKSVQKGDKVVLTYTEALAVSVEPMKKKKEKKD